VITVDGPSGVGKGTVSKAVSQFLGWHFLDSGAVYRVLGYAALQNLTHPWNGRSLSELSRKLKLEFHFEDNDEDSVVLFGESVGTKIRTEQVAKAASEVASYPEVRDALLKLQRSFQRTPGLIADGRDMGTVVFPDAVCKIFLEASAEERANRRYKQLKGKGLSVNLRALLGEIRERDQRDRDRTVAPLRPATDAITLDTSNIAASDVIDQVLLIIQKKIEI